MSEITPKNYNGLMEAYASIYSKPEQTTQEQLEEEICFEDLEVDNDLVVDLVVERLIVEGYADTEDQALNMIPHMSDVWLDNVVGNFVLEESFVDVVNSLVEEGYDLSSYTVDELFEDYIGHFNNCLTEDYRMDLHEVIPLLAAPILANPATWAAGAALGAGALYAGKRAFDAYRQMRSGTSAEGERWLQQGVLQAKTKDKPSQKPAQDQRRLQQARQRVLQRQQQQQQPAAQPQPAKPPTLTREKVAPKGSSGTSTGGTPQGQPGGGDKKPEWVKNFTDALFKKGEKKPPSPMMQQAKQKAAEVAGTAARKIAKGALGLGIGGAVDQGLFGGIGGKLTRDFTRFSRGAGPGYEQLKRELKGEPAPEPKPPAVDTEAEKKRIQNLFK